MARASWRTGWRCISRRRRVHCACGRLPRCERTTRQRRFAVSTAALAAPSEPAAAPGESRSMEHQAPATASEPADRARRELIQGLRRALILSGDTAEPLAQAQAELAGESTAANRLDYALLLLAAQQTVAARAQLSILTHDPEAAAVALRLLGSHRPFRTANWTTPACGSRNCWPRASFLDDALYYLGLIAERHQDVERAPAFLCAGAER